jgi:TonB family protein
MVAKAKPIYRNAIAILSLLIVCGSCLILWCTHVCLAGDVIRDAGDRVRQHLNNLDRQLNPGRRSQPSNAVIHDKWAFLVGVNKYQDKSIKPIKSARNNAMLLAATLKESNVGHFSYGHVAEVVGTAATRDTILGALFNSALIKKSLPTDLIVLYFSGRTICVQEKNDVCLCAYDTLASEPELSGVSLRETLASFRRRTQCPQILCVLDCVPNRPPNQSREVLTVEDLAKSTGVSIMSANLLDAESHACGAGTISCFSQFFSEAMKDTNGYIPIVKLVDFIQTNISQEESYRTSIGQKVVFATAPGSDRAGEVMIGANIRTPWNISQVAIGHKVQTLALVRPELIAPPHPADAPVLDLRNVGSVGDKGIARVAKIVNGATPPDTDDTSNSPNSGANLDAYVAKAKGQIKQKWRPPQGLKEQKVVTTFTVLKSGQIVDSAVVESSGNVAIDASALEALKAASPLEGLPAGSPTSIQIRYVFDWHVTAQ